jgi:predicted dehydrogenase
MKRIKVGIVGCGVMGGFHIKQYGSIPEVEVIGVYDIDPARTPQGITFFKDLSELLKAADAVSITTPTSTHFEVGMSALDAGCHVLIEKPISVTVDQGRKLIEKAKAKKRVLAVGHIERFNPAYVALAAALGRMSPDLIDINRYSPFPARIADVSCVIDMMIHDIDLAIKLAKSEVEQIKAVGKKVKTDKLDQASAVLVFKNGVIANIGASRVHDGKVRQLFAAGKNECYDADLLNKVLKKTKEGNAKSIATGSFDQLNQELKDFVDSIIMNRKPLVTGEDGLSALDVANKIEEEALKTC